MIRLLNVSKRYPGGNEALSNVSLDIAEGEFVFLTGHSGAGKSTLLRLVALLERPSRGEVIVDGHNLERVAPPQIPYYRRQLGLIFQDHRLLAQRSVFDNVAVPLLVCGLADGEIGRRVRAALDKVGLLHREQARAGTLSSGEQQRVGIARAVVNRPRMLLADEPTGNLDPSLSREVLALFRQFNQVGVTVVVATHDTTLLEALPARVIALSHGRVDSAAQNAA